VIFPYREVSVKFIVHRALFAANITTGYEKPN